MELSILIPSYMEGAKIGKDITEAFKFLKKEKLSGEVIVSTDFEEDNTNPVVRALQGRYKNLFLLTNNPKRGKGGALSAGMKKARGRYILFTDAGYCVPFKFALSGLKLLKEGSDLAIASRALTKTKIRRKQPLYRKAGSKVFRLIIHWIGIPKEINDTQCGFKIYKSQTGKRLYKDLIAQGMMFDIEVLLKAKRKKLSIGQFEVEWSNDPDTKFKPISGGLRNLKEIYKIKTKKGL